MQRPATRTPDVEAATARARHLAEGLSGRLRYHAPRHTFDEVLPSALALAQDVGATPHELALVEAAVAYHDLGYLDRRKGHECASVGIARRELPEFGFEPEDLDAIEGMILATRLPQSPTSPLEAVVADADLAIVGDASFVDRSEDLRLELSAATGHVAEQSWYARQLRFLLQHRFHTKAAERRFSAGKRRNVGRVAARYRRALQE